MFIFREESEVLRDVNFFYCNSRCLRSDTLQHALCIVTERTIRFRVELEVYRFGFQRVYPQGIIQKEFSTSPQKTHTLFTQDAFVFGIRAFFA